MHPDPDRLAAFVQGRLSPAEARELEGHLSDCGACCDVLAATAAGPLERLLQQTAPGAPPEPGGGPADGLPELPGYELFAEVGRGGMGVVYKARQKSLNRMVAVKVLRGLDVGDAEMRRRFRAEADILARLRHPNIVTVHEAGLRDGLPYLVLEYVEGGTLKQRLAAPGSAVTPREAAELVEVLAGAMDYAHRQGVIHRDLKPANVLLALSRDAGRSPGPASRLHEAAPKIADFGLAKLLDGERTLSEDTAVAGTPGYMAPEQVLGRAPEIGPHTDVYALGAVLYECLTGRPPFQGPAAAVIFRQVQADDPVAPRRLQPGVPLDLETVCLKCLEKEPARRYATAAALADDLRRFLDGRPVTARPVGPLGRAAKWSRANPLPAVLIGAVALTLVLGTAVSAALAAWALDRSAQAEQQRGKAEEQKGKAEAGERLARRRLYISRMQLAHESWRQGRLVRMRQLLAEQEADADPDDPRSFEWHYLRHLLHSERASFAGAGEVAALAFADGGDRLVALGRGGALRSWDVRTGAETLSRPGAGMAGPGLPLSPDALSLDGTVAVVYGPEAVTVREVASGKEILRTPAGPFALAEDGRSLAVVDPRQGTLDLWDVGAGQGPALRVPTVAPEVVALSARRAWLAAAQRDATVRIWDGRTGQLRHVLRKAHAIREGPIPSNVLTFSPDGTLLASGGDDRMARLWDVQTGSPVGPALAHPGPVRAVTFSPDGGRLAVACAGGTSSEVGLARVWDVRSARELFSIRGHSKGPLAVAFSPDGRALATAGPFDGAVKLWDARQGQEWVALEGASGVVWGAAFSPDGRLLATAGFREPVRVWDVRTGRETLNRGDAGLSWSAPTVSPDGRLMASAGGDGKVRVWGLQGGDEPAVFASGARRVAFAPDGRLAVAGTDGVVRLCDPATGRDGLMLRGHALAVTALAFGPDGRLVTGSHDATARAWDVRTGEETAAFRGHVNGAVLAVAVSPDGTLAASGGADWTARVWEVATGKERHLLRGHAGSVTGVGFSPDGRRLATCGEDGLVRLWDVETGQEVITLEGHAEAAHAVAFSPDGQFLVSCGAGGAIRLWPAPQGGEP